MKSGSMSCPDEDCVAYDAAIRDKWPLLASEALQSVHTATTVRVRDGKVSVTDGRSPKPRSSSPVFYMIEASDLDEAIRIASQYPAGARRQHRGAADPPDPGDRGPGASSKR